MSSATGGRQSPPPEQQQGKQQQDPPADPSQNSSGWEAEESAETLKNLPSNPEHILEKLSQEKTAKTTSVGSHKAWADMSNMNFTL